MPQADKMMIKHKIPAKFFHQKKSSRLSNPSCRTVRKSNALMNYEYGQGISVLVSSRCQEITATGIKPKMAHTNQRGFFSKKTGMLGNYIYIIYIYIFECLSLEKVLQMCFESVCGSFAVGFFVCIGSKKSGRLGDTRPKKTSDIGIVCGGISFILSISRWWWITLVGTITYPTDPLLYYRHFGVDDFPNFPSGDICIRRSEDAAKARKIYWINWFSELYI